MTGDIRQVLIELAQSDHFRANGTAETYRRIATELNHSISPQGTWTWNYLHQIVHSKLKASHALEIAVLRLQNTIKLRDHLEPEFEGTQVLAPAGFVARGAIILTHSRKCLSNLCDRNFIPASGNQKFCSLECRKNFRRKHD